MFTVTHKREVEKIISELKNKKSVGEDEVPVSILKAAADIISEPLVYIINLAFCTGVYPEILKCGNVKLIHKKGNKRNLEMYRPITILSNINKIFEKIMCNRLTEFLDSNNLITDEQNGFRKGKTTIRAVYMALKEILDSVQNKKSTVLMCIDLSKAFDSVDHEILCRKLECYGIRRASLQLIKSYLYRRVQKVVERGNEGRLLKSEPLHTFKGVP
nr:unnamed protein product [Callosobruchus analis]